AGNQAADAPAVLAEEAGQCPVQGLVTLQLAEQAGALLRVFPEAQLQRDLADDLSGLIAEHLAEAGVDVHEAAGVRLGYRDGHRAALEQGGKLLLRNEQLLLV